MENESEFEAWLIVAQFEAHLLREVQKERFTGLYFLASSDQRAFALSLLERLILPDNELKGYLTDLAGASVEFAGKIIDRLLAEFEAQSAAFDPMKRLKYYQNHE